MACKALGFAGGCLLAVIRGRIMKVAVVFFADKNREKLLNISKALARGVEAQGHHVDLIDGFKDVNSKLTIYEYIAVGTAAVSPFGGKIPERISKFLSSAGIVAGKRSFAYVLKEGLRAGKTLVKLMNTMEHEGMFLKYSEVLCSPEEAEEVGKRLHIK
ncbi:MAG: hypothetical protein DRP87_01565 [Spirochaetes bacterium]|nr:MAG: hypothetical protein DRP87_01565 [Spirochaetota bacterium]